MKKIIALLAVIAMIACMIPAAFAAEAALYATSDAPEFLEAGDTFSITVGVSGVEYASIDLANITVPAGLEFVSAEGLGGRMCAPNIAAGKVAAIGFANGSADAVKLTFKVAADAADGKYTISFGKNECADAAGNRTALGAASVTVTVGEPHVCSFGEWVVTTPATCTEEGVETRTCSCGATETRAIAALGHDWDEGTLPETYDCDDVLKTFACSRCDATKTEDASHDHVMAPTAIGERTAEDGSYYVTYQDKCTHAADHGCTAVGETYEKLITGPITGDITPYIAMGVLTMVALVSAAAYMLLKRKAI